MKLITEKPNNCDNKNGLTLKFRMGKTKIGWF